MQRFRTAIRSSIAAARRLCVACGKTSSPTVAGLDAGRRLTARLVEYVAQRGLERPYAAISLEVGPAAATVAEICRAHIREADHRPAAPRILSVDEIHIRKGKDFAGNSDQDCRAVVKLLDTVKRVPLERRRCGT